MSPDWVIFAFGLYMIGDGYGNPPSVGGVVKIIAGAILVVVSFIGGAR